MEDSKKKLVVLLCMHRSGSSLTANILQQLGMSLGPFQLIEAAPSNPYGHFEAIPFHSLNRRVQEWAFGFADDVPRDPEVLARFVRTHGEWPSDREPPLEWFEEAEGYARSLVESGPISGFKDPRTALVWPFWKRVFERLEGIEIVPALLLRSPHEIAMSLCTRSRGDMSYWTALDVVGVHLERMKVVADEEGCGTKTVRFGTAEFWDDTRDLAMACGLNWDEETVRRVYDPSCVHHKPAIVAHRSQEILEEMGRGAWADTDPAANAERIARDARKYEATILAQLYSTRTELGKTLGSLRLAEQQIDESRAKEAESLKVVHELATTHQALVETERGFQLARSCLEQTEKQLARVMESLVSSEERRVQAENLLVHTQGLLAHKEQALAAAHDHQERLLGLFQPMYAAAQAERDEERGRVADLQRRVAELEEASVRKEQQLVRSLDREEKRWLESVALRRRLDKFESNAIIGAAVRGRRQIRQIWLKFRHLGPNGEPRSTRLDRPM